MLASTAVTRAEPETLGRYRNVHPSCVPPKHAHHRLDQLLPDVALFDTISQELRPLRAHAEPFVLLASLGTTGSTQVAAFLDRAGVPTRHFFHIQDMNAPPAKFFTRMARLGPNTTEHLAPIAQALRRGVVDARRYQAMGDTPVPSLFFELYYAICPNVRVILSTRNAVEWASSRLAKHSNQDWLCARNGPLINPFSLAHCWLAWNSHQIRPPGAVGGVLTDFVAFRSLKLARSGANGSSAMRRRQVTLLAEAMTSYNALVQRVVDPAHLLVINLFRRHVSATPADAKRSFDEWTALNCELVRSFVRPDGAQPMERSQPRIGERSYIQIAAECAVTTQPRALRVQKQVRLRSIERRTPSAYV